MEGGCFRSGCLERFALVRSTPVVVLLPPEPSKRSGPGPIFTARPSRLQSDRVSAVEGISRRRSDIARKNASSDDLVAFRVDSANSEAGVMNIPRPSGFVA